MYTSFLQARPLITLPKRSLTFAAGPNSNTNNAPKPTPIRHYMPPVSDVITYPAKDGQPEAKKTIIQSLMGGGQIFGKISELLHQVEKGKSASRPWVFTNLYELQNPALYPERKAPEGTPGAQEHDQLLDRLINLHTQKQAHVRMILDHSKQEPRVLHPDPHLPIKEQPKELMEEFHNDRTLQKLNAHKVKVVTYPHEAALKNHVKLFIINNKQAVVSGMNWGNHSAANHDAGLYIEGPDVRNIFHKVYKPDWITAKGNPEHLPPMKPFHPGKIKVLQTTGRRAEQGAKDEVLREILHQIRNAQSNVQAQLFVLTHKDVVEALIDKHKQLKAKGEPGVQLLVDEGLANFFPNCQPGIKKLDDAGVPIRLFKEDGQNEEKLHAKWAVFDRKHVLMGSANWSSLGLDSKEGEHTEELAAVANEASPESPRKIPYKTNHEIGVMVEDVPNVGENFAKQADYDFNFQPGIPPKDQLSIPVSWRKWDPQKPWSEQRFPSSSWKKPNWRPGGNKVTPLHPPGTKRPLSPTGHTGNDSPTNKKRKPSD